jgi:hypothetical protein
MEHRLEQVKSRSVAANGAVARTMATGYVPDMILGKNSHCVIPPLDSHSRFGAGAD